MKTDPEKLNPVTETRHREERMGNGVLRIEEQYVNGELFSSVFTLESLAHVMGLPMSTMEGRYKRANLSRWMVPVRQYNGRPIRGFPYALLDQVMYAIDHPRAMIVSSAGGSVVKLREPRAIGELVPEYFLGERYYTIPALARAFGYTETTIRKKMQVSGLSRHFRNLAPPKHGGRPKRGIPEKFLAQVKLAISDDAEFRDKYSRLMYKESGELQAARDQMKAAIVPHTPPHGLQAWDPQHLTPVTKVPVTERQTPPTLTLDGKPDYSDDPAMADLMAAVETALAMQADLPPLESTAPNHQTIERSDQPATSVPGPASVNVVNSEPRFTSLPTDEQARKAEREQEAANRAKLVPLQRQMLIDEPDEPTDEQLDLVCYGLDLTGQARDEFIQSVREGRRQRLAATSD